MDTVVEELANYQAAVEKMLDQQSIVVSVKKDKLDVLGPEIARMARELESTIFDSLEVEADVASAETDLALRFTLMAFVVSLVLGLIVAVLMSRMMGVSVKRAKTEILGYLDDIANNNGDLSTRLTPGRPDEIGDFIGAVNTFLETLEKTISQIVRASRQLTGESESLSGITERTTANSEQQRDQITQVSAAMQEMVSTSEEIASNTSETDESARKAASLADSGQETVGSAIRAVTNLANQVEKGSTRIQQLENESAEIGNVLAVIQSIAEQTNLLALNAAIEAARAGEQGRGFAVVADEVRSLARRTRESTVRIQNVIDDFRQQVDSAVQATRDGEAVAGQGLEKVREAESSLKDIVTSIETISDSLISMSAAFEEQGQVSDEMNRQITNIAELADHSDAQADSAKQSSDRLSTMSRGLKDLISRFISKDG